MLSYIEYVYCVYKEGSFSKAADKMCISQPSLSIAIKKAEKEAGFPIFDRRKHPISLTAFGVEYIRAIEQIYDIEDRLGNYVGNLENLEQGNLSVGGSNFSVSYIVSEVIAEFKRLYPKVNLDVRETNTLRSLHMMDSGELDLAVTNRPLDESKYKSVLCYHEHLVLAVPDSFSINSRFSDSQRLKPEELQRDIFDIPAGRCISLREFAEVPFIMLRSGNYLRQCVDSLFQECRIAPHIVLEFEQSAISYNFASLGLGATILSNMLVEESSKNTRLCFYKIDSGLAVRSTYLAYSRNCYISFAMRRFIEMLTEKSRPYRHEELEYRPVLETE